jgi:hypothetical protein
MKKGEKGGSASMGHVSIDNNPFIMKEYKKAVAKKDKIV